MKKQLSQMLEQYSLDPNICSLPAPENWLQLSRLLNSEIPFEAHQKMYELCFEDIGSDEIPIAWRPTQSEIGKTNIGQWMHELGHKSYADFFKFSTQNYTEFWAGVIDRLKIPFKRPYNKIVNLVSGPESPVWLDGAELNIADACFTADGNKTAITYRDFDSNEIHKISYDSLQIRVNQAANSLAAAGFKRGDAIAIDMLMTVEAVVIYLAIIKAGMTAVSIADSFATDEIATRLRISKSVAVFTQDYTIRGDKKLPMYEKVKAAAEIATVEGIGSPKIIVLQTKGSDLKIREQDLFWNDFLLDKETFESVSCKPDQPVNILFSSGTTGDPKAIPWDHTTPIKAAMDGMLHHDIHPGDVIAWPTNLGWMMGPWLIYAALMNQATIALCYPPPMTKEFGDFVTDAKVTMLGLVPSIVKAWQASGVMTGMNWSTVKCFSSTGEVSNPQEYLFLMSLAGYRPVIEYCGGTEIGGGYVTGTMVQDASPSTFTTPALGLDFVVLDDQANPTSEGELFLIPPSIGLSNQLLNKNHYEVYFEGAPKLDGKVLRRHGDQIHRLANGYFRAQGRADDTMNLGGIKTSSAEIERTCNQASMVIETAAIAVPPPGGGPDRLVIFAVAKDSNQESLKIEFQNLIKKGLNPLFRVHDVEIVEKLPRTASNKVMRRVLRKDYQQQHKA